MLPHFGQVTFVGRSDASAVFVINLFRLVNHGKGMMQPHQITAEYNAAIPEAEREKLKDTAFEDLLRGAQV